MNIDLEGLLTGNLFSKGDSGSRWRHCDVMGSMWVKLFSFAGF